MYDPWLGREKARLRNERSIERAIEKEKIRKQKSSARSEKKDAALRARLASRIAELAGMFSPEPKAARKHDNKAAIEAQARQHCAKTEAALQHEVKAAAYWTLPRAITKAEARVERARQRHADALAKLAAFGGAPYVPGTPHVKGKQPKIMPTGETRTAWIARRAEERYQASLKGDDNASS